MKQSQSDYRCFSIRRVNPFRGVIQIVQSSCSRAISTDGNSWEIQIKTKKPDDMWGAEGPAGSTLQYLRFGNWSKDTGLRKVPAHPLLDIASMLKESQHLTRFLADHDDSLPFPLIDRFESWLLDGKHRRPLALLASSARQDELPEERPYRWQCAIPFSPDFSALEWDEAHPAHPKDTAPTPHIDALNRLVSIESGHALAQWFERIPSGEGVGLPVSGFDELDGRVLPPEAFPEMLLREVWSDCYDTALVADYIRWLSPVLLTLQHLTDDRRMALEAQAKRHATKVEMHWNFYPKIIDRGAIDAARVEARLRNANARQKGVGDK